MVTAILKNAVEERAEFQPEEQMIKYGDIPIEEELT
jgi:hypothetical protein